MQRCAILLLALVGLQVNAGPAWRWIDADGTVHYSDRPVPGAVEVFLPDAATPAAPPPSPAATPAATAAPGMPTADRVVPVAAGAQYSELVITSPSPDETLWNLGGELTVSVGVRPQLREGHRLVLLYDGAPVSARPNAENRFTVSEVYRGIHTVQAVIADATNTQVMRSLPVQFVVQQTSIQNPNRN